VDLFENLSFSKYSKLTLEKNMQIHVLVHFTLKKYFETVEKAEV
jgi:hypothetical protein